MALNVGYVSRETAQNLGRNPTLTIASVVTVAIALTLAGVSLLVRQGVDDLSGRFRGDVQIVVFVEADATQEQIDSLRRTLEENPEVADATYVDREASFEEAQELFADSEVMSDLLRPEDIPTSFRVTPRNPDIEAVVALRSVLDAEQGVLEVVSADEAIQAIQQLSSRLRFGVLFAAAISAGIAVLLIYNTIRTAMFARRREIEVMKLVGATNWFIRVPFILEGMVQALLGGFLSVAMLLGVNSVLFQSLSKEENLEIFQDFDFTVSTVIGQSVWLVLAGALLGAVGSGFAVGRFLDV
ncbi:ABC transporter permease [Iamia sp. SCSIO 61187]|uniref:cell division protein FtsX n=1 Tax=Iamia sp. SCSIO 61187 TaxID=2722752 RepID=UPI001C62A917|nr:permease-like cell division protein FtsX [Iamia sp. SCSIO 61187]QYG92409.1 ABC transporter permease [Iamia sp. SCSIO 61187]